MNNRAELHCHTKMSEMEGLTDVGELIRKAQKMKMPAIAITDYGNVQAFPEAYEAWIRASAECDEDENPVKVLYGLETYIVNDLDIIVLNDKGQSIYTDYVVFDLETTGFSAVSDRIIEIGAVKISNGQVTDSFSCFVNPEIQIPDKIVDLTGITNEMVSNAETINVVLPRFLDFCNNTVLVAHNAPFDLSFVRENMKKMGLKEDFTVVDTLHLCRLFLKDVKRRSLGNVAAALGIPIHNLHRAVDDAQLTSKIFLRFIDLMKEQNISLLSELSVRSRMNYSMTRTMAGYKTTIIATDTEGVKNLFDLISEVSFDSFDSFLKIPKSLLAAKREGLIIGSCAQGGEVSNAVFWNPQEESVRNIARFYDYVEIEPVNNYIYELGHSPRRDDRTQDQVKETIKKIIQICNKESVPVVASANVYYLEKSDVEAFKVLRHAFGFRDTKGWEANHHLMSTEEMLKEFEFLGQETAQVVVIDNPQKLIEGIELWHPLSPRKAYPGYPKAFLPLETRCYERAYELYGEKLPDEVESRIRYELEALKSDINRYFASIYMIVHELVKMSKNAGYTVGARGCSGASLVSYLMGITETNPLPPHYTCRKCEISDFAVSEIKGFQVGDVGADLPDRNCPICGRKMRKDGYNIPVETFLGLNMDKEPDFDINFSNEYMNEAQRNVASIDGVGSICRAGTIETLTKPAALKYTQIYYKDKKSRRKEESIARIAEKLVGVKTKDDVHPYGIIPLPTWIDEIHNTPILPGINDSIPRTQIDYHNLDGLLLKLDIIGHDSPTILRKLKEFTGIDPQTIPLNDRDVMNLFLDTKALGVTPDQIGGVCVGTLGVGEFGCEFARGVIEKVKPKNFSDLIRIHALCHGTGTWFNNAECLLAEGIPMNKWITNRDDIMLFLQNKGVDHDKAFEIMEWIRKGRGFRTGLPAEYLDVMRKHNVPEWYIKSCEKIQYLFPKAHSAAYTLTLWRLLYYKLYYPEAFYRTWLEFALEADRNFAEKGPEHAKTVLESLRKKNPNRLGHRQKRALDEIPVILEMYARGVNI